MFKSKEESKPGSLIEDVEKTKVNKKIKTKKPKQKCENCKRCWGFFDFLKTSWKLFKEFTSATSIHGLRCHLWLITLFKTSLV